MKKTKPLTEKQKFVMELRMGLKDGKKYTQREIASLMGISQEAVRKHQEFALTKIERSGWGFEEALEDVSEVIHGDIYFIEAPSVGLVKIGFTTNLSGRIKSLRAGSPVELKFWGSVRGTMKEEKKIHNQFSNLRSHGEWFRNEGSLTSVFEGLSRVSSSESQILECREARS